ncbi:uncharacterized protein METZ01_LOCUS482280, partial [marine metagenome]
DFVYLIPVWQKHPQACEGGEGLNLPNPKVTPKTQSKHPLKAK